MGMFSGMKFTRRFVPERLHINLARLKKNGRSFEIVVDPDKAMAFRQGTISDIREVLTADRIFENAQKGIASSAQDLKTIFGDLDTEEIAEFILRKGELQMSSNYREVQSAEKKRRILEIIHRNAVNSQNNLPHPLVRLENAWEEARIKIDDKKSAEDQLQDVLKKLKVILPLKFEHKEVQIHIAEKYAKKYFKAIHRYGKLMHEDWLDDGCYLCVIEVPAGLYLELVDDLSKKTHGGVEIKVLSEKNKGFYEN